LGFQSGMIPIILIADGDSVSLANQIIHCAFGLVQAVSGINNPLVLHQAVEHAINLAAAGHPVQFTAVLSNNTIHPRKRRDRAVPGTGSGFCAVKSLSGSVDLNVWF
jgi:hypothetical protein